MKRSISVQEKLTEKEKFAKRLFAKYKKQFCYNSNDLEEDKSEDSKILLNMSGDNETDLLSIVDLYRNPNKYIRINSPRSLRAIYETGCCLEELYYMSLNGFLEYHKEFKSLSKEEQVKRYNFYNQMRISKIKDLCKYRAFIIREENEKKFGKTNTNTNTNLTRSERVRKISNGKNNEKITIKSAILNNHNKIVKEEISNIKKKHDKELANIIELELEKNLGSLEISKQEQTYNNKNKKLNFINLNGREDTSSPIENERYLQKTQHEFKFRNKKNDKKSSDEKNDNSNIYKDDALSVKKRKIVLNIDERNSVKENLYALQNEKVSLKFDKNQKKVEKKLERVEKMNKIKADQMAMKKRIVQERTDQNLQKNAENFKNKQENLVNEIELKNFNIHQNKNQIARSIALTNGLNNEKYILTQNKIVRMKSAEDKGRRIKYMQLLQKHFKYNNIKIESNIINQGKQYKLKYLDFMRQRNIRLIKQLLQRGIDEENLQKIILAFPENSDIYNVIQNYYNRKNRILNGKRSNSYKTNKFMGFNSINLTTKNNNDIKPKSQRKFVINIKSSPINTNGSNLECNTDAPKNINIDKRKLTFNKDRKKLTISLNTKKINNNYLPTPSNSYNFGKNHSLNFHQNNGTPYSENEIKKMVGDYRENIYKGFFKRVEDEKMRELGRTQQLKITKDRKIKNNLEKHFAKERALADKRLKIENLNIGEQVRVYEDILRKKNEINQN